jgi:hypothetical protein
MGLQNRVENGRGFGQIITLCLIGRFLPTYGVVFRA